MKLMSKAAQEIVLGRESLTLSQLAEVLDAPFQIRVDESARRRVVDSRAWVERAIADGKACYGVNTGFGHLKNVRIPADQLEQLQVNLLRSHAVGVGPSASPAIVRWMLLFKIQGLIQGYSGVRWEIIQRLMEFLNSDCLSVVPMKGSLGASGDLAPLAHLSLPVIGEGEVVWRSQRSSALAILKQLHLEPIRLAAKEGLALINGTQYMSAVAAQVVVRAMQLAEQADVVGTMSLEALRGSAQPFDERLHHIRPHGGASQVAHHMRFLLTGSQIMESHKNCDKVQDPYSVRCMAQVHGAVRDALDHARSVVEIEINSVTDNPIICENGEMLSGGNFHGQSLAMVMDYLAIALAELASISERRTYLLLSGHDGLPPMLIPDAGLNSGLMIMQYTAAALVNENKVLAHPASVDTIPTSMGQEDHVSMGATSANKLLNILENVERVLAIELLCAAQGLEFRKPNEPGQGLRPLLAKVRRAIPTITTDRLFQKDIEQSLAILQAKEH